MKSAHFRLERTECLANRFMWLLAEDNFSWTNGDASLAYNDFDSQLRMRDFRQNCRRYLMGFFSKDGSHMRNAVLLKYNALERVTQTVWSSEWTFAFLYDIRWAERLGESLCENAILFFKFFVATLNLFMCRQKFAFLRLERSICYQTKFLNS